MLAVQLGAIQFVVILYKVQNDFTIERLKTPFAKEGQKFYINIFYNSSNTSVSNMMNTYLAKQLQVQMAVPQK